MSWLIWDKNGRISQHHTYNGRAEEGQSHHPGGGLEMSELSLSEIVGRLKGQIEIHRRQEAFHAEQEALHRDRREVHAAELEALTRSVAALEAAASAAVELARRPAPGRLSRRAGRPPQPARAGAAGPGAAAGLGEAADAAPDDRPGARREG